MAQVRMTCFEVFRVLSKMKVLSKRTLEHVAKRAKHVMSTKTCLTMQRTSGCFVHLVTRYRWIRKVQSQS